MSRTKTFWNYLGVCQREKDASTCDGFFNLPFLAFDACLATNVTLSQTALSCAPLSRCLIWQNYRPQFVEFSVADSSSASKHRAVQLACV